jgi:hypothetical protein
MQTNEIVLIGIVFITTLFISTFILIIYYNWVDVDYAMPSENPEERKRRRSSVKDAIGRRRLSLAPEQMFGSTESLPGRVRLEFKAGHTRWKKPERQGFCQRLASIIGSGFGLPAATRSFWQWHVAQSMIYGWRFVIFQAPSHRRSPPASDFVRPELPRASSQVSVNLFYGVATSFWYFFIPFYLDEKVGLGPVQNGELQALLNLAPIFKPLQGIITGRGGGGGGHGAWGMGGGG